MTMLPQARRIAVLAAVLLLGATGAHAPAAPVTPETGGGQRIRSTDDFQARDAHAVDPATAPGRAVYEAHCAACHQGGVPKAPSPTFLQLLPGDAIVGALTNGVMRQQGAALSSAEKVQVAEYLTRRRLADATPPAMPPPCRGAAAEFDMKDAPPALGWGHDNRRFVPAAIAGLAPAAVPSLRLAWAHAFPRASRARSQPTAGWGALFVGSQDGTVYAFDLATGCTRWTRRISAEIRTAIVADAKTRRLYFGDLLGRAHALDALTGKPVWSVKIDDHADATITGTPTLGGDRLFVPVSSLEVAQPADPDYACCTFRGSVAALDPATGRLLWRAFTIPEPPAPHGRSAGGTPVLGPSGAPVWNSPTYDAVAGRVYFGSGENYSSPADGNSDAVFAVDARTGKRIWRTQLTAGDAWNVACMLGTDGCPAEKGPDFDVAASPLLIPLSGGKRMLVAGQKSGEVWGLDPLTGRIVWRRRLGHGGTQGGVHFGMAAIGQTVFVPINDMPNTGDARVYDEKQRGSGLHAIDAATGRPIWTARAPDDCAGAQFCDSGISAAVTAIPGVVFAGHLDGRFRAYAADDGHILWQVDTTKPVRTVSGAMGHGGSMSGPGALVVGGRVVVNSGYGMYSHMGGNLLMVFARP